jgi:hypothetical protein
MPNMAFMKEHSSLYKTALSDLQGAWQNLRDEVVEHYPFQDSDRLLFQIDEGMSWEAVRDLTYMRKTLLIIKNIAARARAPADVTEGIEYVLRSIEEVFAAIEEGKIGWYTIRHIILAKNSLHGKDKKLRHLASLAEVWW